MALTKVIGNGLGTLGDGTANDTKIVFDGNAQDYHIGLDDSADTLVIGKGSALGTTTSMSFDANGIITKPLQPAFLVYDSSVQSNISNNTTVTFDTEVFDRNGDFSSSTFVAPVTGLYQLNFIVRVDDLDKDANWTRFQLVTSNRTYEPNIVDPGVFASDPDYWNWTIAVLADMDASDTAAINFQQDGGGAQVDIGTAYFSGYLVC